MPNTKIIKTMLPKEYFNVLKRIIKKANLLYDNNLVDIMVAGSGGKGLIIDNWSDLDIYIITKSYDLQNNIVFHKYLKTIKNVHIGETFITKNDFFNKKVDDKTLVSMYEHINGNNPLIFDNIDVPLVSKTELFRMYEYKKYVVYQSAERSYLNYIYNNGDFKLFLKKITVLIKCYLLLKYNLFTTGYNEVFNSLFKVWNREEIFDVQKIIKCNNKCMDNIYYDILVRIQKEL